MIRLYGLAAAVVLCALLPSPARAQFSAAPAIVRLSVAAADGGAATAMVRVRNEGDAALQFRMYLSDYDQSEDGDFRFDDFGGGRGTCAGRLSVFPEAAVLKPGEVQEVRVRLAGGSSPCWALLFVESSTSSDAQVRVAQRIGVRIVELDRATTDGEIEAVTVHAAPDSVAVSVLFANLGTAPAELRGSVEIRSLASGEVVRTVALGPLGVLPGLRRRIDLRLANDLTSGRYVVVPIIDFGGDYLAGGQATVAIP